MEIKWRENGQMTNLHNRKLSVYLSKLNLRTSVVPSNASQYNFSPHLQNFPRDKLMTGLALDAKMDLVIFLAVRSTIPT